MRPQDEGDVGRIQPRSITSQPEIEGSPFAFLCRAALLVEAALKYTWNSATESTSSHVDKASELIEEISRFLAVVDDCGQMTGSTNISWLGPRAVARSALFLTLDRFTCPEKISGEPGYILTHGVKTSEELQMQKRAMNLVRELSDQSQSLASSFAVFVDMDVSPHRELARISPFALDLMYCSLATYYWLAGEQGNEPFQVVMSSLRTFLAAVGSRWKLSREYLSLSRYHDALQRASLFAQI